MFGKSTNNAVQILLSGDVQSWNVLHPVLHPGFYFCLSVNGVLLPVDAPSGSFVRAFLSSPLTRSHV